MDCLRTNKQISCAKHEKLCNIIENKNNSQPNKNTKSLSNTQTAPPYPQNAPPFGKKPIEMQKAKREAQVRPKCPVRYHLFLIATLKYTLTDKESF